MHETDRKQKQGQCLLCQRQCALTFHHLIPRKVSRRSHYRKRYNKAFLARGINICRLCHNGLHDIYTEMELAKQFSTLAELQADEALSKHYQWVSKQKA